MIGFTSATSPVAGERIIFFEIPSIATFAAIVVVLFAGRSASLATDASGIFASIFSLISITAWICISPLTTLASFKRIDVCISHGNYTVVYRQYGCRRGTRLRR